ncbi:hypothetical protein KI387_036353, partial [Taxus chinensis]
YWKKNLETLSLSLIQTECGRCVQMEQWQGVEGGWIFSAHSLNNEMRKSLRAP